MSLVLPIIAIGGTAVLILLLFMFTNKSKVTKEVMFMRPRDKRGEKMAITRETDRSVLCEQTNPVHRFIKIGPAWTFKDGGHTSYRFLGIEGSAYTAMLKEASTIKLTVREYLLTLWGNKIYDALPTKMRDAVEKDEIGITIEPEKINPDDYGLEAMSPDDVNDEGDATILNRLAKFGQGENARAKMMNNLIWLGLGLGIAAILSHWIPGL